MVSSLGGWPGWIGNGEDARECAILLLLLLLLHGNVFIYNRERERRDGYLWETDQALGMCIIYCRNTGYSRHFCHLPGCAPGRRWRLAGMDHITVNKRACFRQRSLARVHCVSEPCFIDTIMSRLEQAAIESRLTTLATISSQSPGLCHQSPPSRC